MAQANNLAKISIVIAALTCCIQSTWGGIIESKFSDGNDIQTIDENQTRAVVVNGDCAFRVNGDLQDPAPLFIHDVLNEWIEPNPSGVVELRNGDYMRLYCSNTSFMAPFSGASYLRVQCLQGLYFLVDGLIHTFQSFTCTAWPKSVARRTGRSCNGGTDLLEVGYFLEEEFLQRFDICHNEHLEVTRYAHHVLTPSSAAYQHSVPRPSFAVGDFYGGKDVNQLYTKIQQNITISNILGIDASPYFNGTDIYLARGHMCAKVDFIFGTQHMATFYFVNVAPQWQAFNGGNWERVEDGVRKFVAARAITTDCYTGVWGVATLPDKNGVHQELYLDFDENNNGLIPVPKLYFRVVIDRASRQGIVLIGVNNPHATIEEIERDYVICPDVSDGIDWLGWDKRNLVKGYSYACSVPDFIAVVQDLPLEDLTTSGLLGIDNPATPEDPKVKYEFY